MSVSQYLNVKPIGPDMTLLYLMPHIYISTIRRMGYVQQSSVTSVCLGSSRTMISMGWLILFVPISAWLFSYLCKLAPLVVCIIIIIIIIISIIKMVTWECARCGDVPLCSGSQLRGSVHMLSFSFFPLKWRVWSKNDHYDLTVAHQISIPLGQNLSWQCQEAL